MCKFVFRDIGETWERFTCRVKVHSQSSRDNAKNELTTNSTYQQRRLQPGFVACSKDLCRSVRGTSIKIKKDSKRNAGHSWTEVTGWVSVCHVIRWRSKCTLQVSDASHVSLVQCLSSGWVVCLVLCLQKFFGRDDREIFRNKFFDRARVSCIT